MSNKYKNKILQGIHDTRIYINTANYFTFRVKIDDPVIVKNGFQIENLLLNITFAFWFQSDFDVIHVYL